MTQQVVDIQGEKRGLVGALKKFWGWLRTRHGEVAPLPLLITFAIGAAIWFTPVPTGLAVAAWHMLAIFVSTVVGIVMRPLPVSGVVLAGLTVALLTGTLGVPDVFGAFASDTVWLIALSFFLAKGLIKTGLATRISYLFVKAFGRSPLGLAYGIIAAELLLAPFIPSIVARSAGIIFPIVLALLQGEGMSKAKGMGPFLIMTVFQAAVVVSAMFMTSMAANPLAVQIVGEMGVTISWMKWAVAAIVPGLASLIAIPWIISKVAPPGVKATPEAPKMASEKLAEMGKMKRPEWLMAGTFGVVFVLWLFGDAFGVSAVTAACVGLVMLLITGVLRWKDCLEETTAWDTLFWLGSLIMMGSALKKLGLFTWITAHLGGLAVLPAIPLLGLLVLVYFYAHYFFASNVAHLSAMFAAFVALAIGMGAPAMLTALLFSFSSALFGGLTHYGCGPAPVYFGAGQVKMGKWWLVGLIVSLVNVVIWGGLGTIWWKFLGYW